MRANHRITIFLFVLSLFFSACAVVQANAQKPASSDREKQAAAEFKQLLDLRKRVQMIPDNGDKREPHKSFLKANEKSVVYNDPAGQWILRSDLFWDLRDKYTDVALADDIAWEAAQNPVAGECEGYMNCGVYISQITAVRYLGYYPAGKHSKAALGELKDSFGSYADESKSGTSYSPPEEASDKAELQKMLKDIDAVVAKVPAAEAAEIRGFIKTIAGRYK